MLEVKTREEVGFIQFNFEELNQKLDIELKKYSNLVFDETQIKEAKDVRANLNKVVKEINDKKKEIKAIYCQPYVDFENKVKILMDKINVVNSGIDEQIKSFEVKQKEEKKKRIFEYFKALDFNLVDFERLFNEKWLNKTCSLENACNELKEEVDRIQRELDICNRIIVPNKNRLQAHFLRTLDIYRAELAYNEEMKQEKLLAEHKAKQEEQARMHVEQKLATQSDVIDVEVVQVPKQEELLVRAFKVQGTKEQLIQLGNYMNEKGIKFQKIELSKQK